MAKVWILVLLISTTGTPPRLVMHGFGQATATSSSASVLVEPNQLPRNVVRFYTYSCIFVLHVCS